MIGATATSLGVGLGSALLPVVNAEGYVAAAGAAGHGGVAVVLALALGQTLGKVVLVEVARRGGRLRHRSLRAGRSDVNGMRHGSPGSRGAGGSYRSRVNERWRRGVERLDSPVVGGAVVGCSASIGLPPLAAVAVAAGLRGQSLRVFVPWCFVGRTLRFGALALGVAFVVES